MYDFIEGELVKYDEEELVLQSGGIGYLIMPSRAVLADLPPRGELTRIFVHLEVKEDDLSLYGFADRKERELFRMILSVSRIGPKTALTILSSMRREEFRRAVVEEEERVLTEIKGIGKKTARRLILELKDKMPELEALPQAGIGDGAVKTALRALTSDSMGFSPRQAREALARVQEEAEGEELSVEQLVSGALKEMS